MPKIAKVSVEEAITVLRQFIDHFKGNNLPILSENVWKEISNYLNGRWTPRDAYREIREDRRGILSEARKRENISITDDVNVTLNTSAFTDSLNEEIDTSGSEVEGLETFQVCISENLWQEISESEVVIYGKKVERTYLILKPYKWTDIIFEEFFKHAHLPCAYVFKNARKFKLESALRYIRIKAQCKSKLCKNPFFGYVDTLPNENGCFLKIKTRDTFYEKHEDVRRPLKGLRRKQVAREVLNEGCSNWLKRQAAKYASEGSRLPPNLPTLDVLRQCKKEALHEELGVKLLDGKDVVATVEQMRHQYPFHEFIHDVRREKFYVMYSTPSQLHAYKRYCKVSKISRISVDGTGSIVKPVKYSHDGKTSGHIFLYAIVINYNSTTLSVYHMITECQDTNLLQFWLRQWLILGAPKPVEASCDSSRALINALSLALNDQTIKVYMDTLFLCASKHASYYERPQIFTYVRLDVAHFIKMITRWTCMKNMQLKVKRKFYLYCIGLLIDSQTLLQFREVYFLICVVALNEFQDTILETTNLVVIDARLKLEELIATHQLNFIPQELEFPEEQFDELNEDITCGNHEKTNPRMQWIDDIRSMAKSNETNQSGDLNAFYSKQFIDRLMKVIYEFPLWTAACLPYHAEHSTTSFVEGFFNDKKNRVLRKVPGRIRADVFLKLEHQDYVGNSAIFQSKMIQDINMPNLNRSNDLLNETSSNPQQSIELIKTNINTKSPQKVFMQMPLKSLDINDLFVKKPTPDPDTRSIDNWRNKARIHPNDRENSLDEPVESKIISTEKKRKGTYFTKQPDISHRNNFTSVKRAPILQNGNVRNAVLINKHYYLIQNTCPFDSIIQVLVTTAMDNSYYYSYVQNSDNITLKFIANVIKNGVNGAVYKDRVTLLKSLFPNKVQTPRWDLMPYTVDMWDSAAAVWTKCFVSAPSALVNYNCNCGSSSSTPIITLPVNHKVIWEKGFNSLQNALLSNTSNVISCKMCQKQCCTTTLYNRHIFLELDIRINMQTTHGMKCSLEEIPTTLNLGTYNNQNIEYGLHGLISYCSGHFIAYCRRANGHWEEHDDSPGKIEAVRATTKIEPHAAVYIEKKLT